MKRETERKDRREEDHIRSGVYFLLGVLLSICIAGASVLYVLPKLAVRNMEEGIRTVTSELVRDTVKSSLGEYLAANKIAVSDESMSEITQYITDSVNGQTELTGNQIEEVKSLVRISIQNTNENLNNSMVMLQEFVVNGDSEISGALKDYIDKYVVPGITASLEMNSNDIISVNETIVEMGKEYNSYCEANEADLSEIIGMMDRYRQETEAGFADAGKSLEESRLELSEKTDAFYEEYNSYVESTDEKMDAVREKLNEYVTITDFKEFEKSYEVYKENMGETIAGINDALALLEDKKADKKTVEELAENFGNLKNTYDEFTGESGRFAALTERVTTAETNTAQNSSEIAVLENRITELEQKMNTEDGISRDSISALEARMNKFYPAGSVYMTFGNENPADLFGGTWEKVEDTFLMAAGNAYPLGTNGGSNTAVLNAVNIPSLNISGSTAAKNGIGTSAGGAYNGTVTSQGTYTGGTYGTSADGNHQHGLNMGASAVGRIDGNYGAIFTYAGQGGTESAGNHSHTVSIPSQTITSSGGISIGNHSHSVNIPSLALTGKYTNNSLQSVDITNKYVTVNVWKRVA